MFSRLKEWAMSFSSLLISSSPTTTEEEDASNKEKKESGPVASPLTPEELMSRLIQANILPEDAALMTETIMKTMTRTSISFNELASLPLNEFRAYLNNNNDSGGGKFTQTIAWRVLRECTSAAAEQNQSDTTTISASNRSDAADIPNTAKKSRFAPFAFANDEDAQLWIIAELEDVPLADDRYAHFSTSPDGTRLYAGVYKHVGAWDLGTGELIAWFNDKEHAHASYIGAMCVSSCGTFLISHGEDDSDELFVWDTVALKLLRKIPCHAVWSANLHVCNDYLILFDMVSKFTMIRIGGDWIVERTVSLQLPGLYLNPSMDSQEYAMFSWSEIVSVASSGSLHAVLPDWADRNSLVVYDLADGGTVRKLRFEAKPLIVKPVDDKYLLVVLRLGVQSAFDSRDTSYEVVMIDIQTSSVIVRIPLGNDRVTAMCTWNEERIVAIATEESISMYTLPNGTRCTVLQFRNNTLDSMSFTRDCKALVGSSWTDVLVWKDMR